MGGQDGGVSCSSPQVKSSKVRNHSTKQQSPCSFSQTSQNPSIKEYTLHQGRIPDMIRAIFLS